MSMRNSDLIEPALRVAPGTQIESASDKFECPSVVSMTLRALKFVTCWIFLKFQEEDLLF